MIYALQGMSDLAKENNKGFPSIIFTMIQGAGYLQKAITVRPDKVKPKTINELKQMLALINGYMEQITEEDKENLINHCTKDRVDDYKEILAILDYVSVYGDQETKTLCAGFLFLLDRALNKKPTS